MNQPTQLYKNRVLAALSEAEIGRLAPHLKPVTLEQEHVLLDGEANYGYFLEDGIASVVATVADGGTVEVGIIGIDGVVGVPILLGIDGGGPVRTFIQIAGSGYRIDAKILKQEFDRSGELCRHLYRYMQAFFVQTAQTAACNRLHGIEGRLARWLASCRDRMETDNLRLTHEFLGQMLGAPRTTVTLAAGLLHRAGLIDYSRGLVTIKNRAALENAACDCYAIVRDEYKRLGIF
jgi:CRP-like cAMP-binding protein